MGQIIFNDERIQETINQLKVVLENFEISFLDINDNLRTIEKDNDLPQMTKTLFRKYSQCKKQCENIEMLIDKLKRVQEVYLTVENKNRQIIEELPEKISMSSQYTTKLGKAIGNVNADFSKEAIKIGSIINGHNVQHEDWLMRVIKNYI